MAAQRGFELRLSGEKPFPVREPKSRAPLSSGTPPRNAPTPAEAGILPAARRAGGAPVAPLRSRHLDRCEPETARLLRFSPPRTKHRAQPRDLSPGSRVPQAARDPGGRSGEARRLKLADFNPRAPELRIAPFKASPERTIFPGNSLIFHAERCRQKWYLPISVAFRAAVLRRVNIAAKARKGESAMSEAIYACTRRTAITDDVIIDANQGDLDAVSNARIRDFDLLVVRPHREMASFLPSKLTAFPLASGALSLCKFRMVASPPKKTLLAAFELHWRATGGAHRLSLQAIRDQVT